jgi:uncharacterized protein (DUF362 family)
MPEKRKTTVILRSVASTPIAEAVRDSLVQCDWESWLSRNAVVVIKPNLCTAAPEKIPASNTDVVLVEALCEALLTRTDRIYIGESGHLRQSPWQTFAASGYVEMAQRLGVELVNFSEEPTTSVKCEPIGELAMPRRLLEADVYINVPVLKTHALTYFTGALKNQWGCVPDCHDRLRYHRSINTMLSSLQRLLQPKFVLMDAIVGMEGRGPVAGQARRLDAILASRDAVAIDATAMRLVGLNPEKARHVVLAAQQGLGSINANEIDVNGEWERLATTFAPPPRDFANRAMFYATQHRWFVTHVLGNDRLYYPIRDFVKLLRRARMVAK